MIDLKLRIQDTLKSFPSGSPLDNSQNLFSILGYKSEKTFFLRPNNYQGFAYYFIRTPGVFDPIRARTTDWKSIDIVFQLTEDELKSQHT